MKRSVILAISDLQEPFSHRDALSFVLHVKKTFVKADDELIVINVGDEVDQHTLGRWTANPNGRSGGDELKEAKHRLRDWFREFPHTKVCVSNHTYRVFKRAMEAGIPSEFMRTIGEVYDAPPGWRWADRWIVNGNILFEHGENVSGPTAALNAALQNRMSTVIGHQHSHGGVIHSASPNDVVWGLNTGCLIDIEQYAFDYGKTLRRKPTLGMGIIIDGLPLFIPMVLNQKGRWIGRTI